MITDPIADMLIRIKNGILVQKQSILIPYSKIKMAILKILKKEEFIEDFSLIKDKFPQIEVKLKQGENNLNFDLKRISTPGQRIYSKSKDLPLKFKGQGMIIVSTSQGIMTTKEAKNKGLGGEILFAIW